MKTMLNSSENYLRKIYPFVYSHTKEFLCKDGWFSILNHFGLIANFHLRKKNENAFLPKIREKFGILIIEYESIDDSMWGFINHAQRLSYYTCEICGNSGKLYSSTKQKNSFAKLKTFCNKHALAKLYWEV